MAAAVALSVLKEGLAAIRKHIGPRQNDLEQRIARSESITSEDERWLDEEGNVIDEEWAITDLETASDYERGWSRLNAAQKKAVKRLRVFAEGVKKKLALGAVAGDKKKPATSKRKRPDHSVAIPDDKTPGKKRDVAPVFTKKENATLQQRIEILDWFHSNGKNQTKTAKHFDPIYPNLLLKQPLVSAWVNEEAKWREQYARHDVAAQKIKRQRQTQHPEIEQMMELWVAQAMAHGIQLSGEALRQKWTAFADLVGVDAEDRLALSNGWLGRFKNRTGLRELKRHGEAASADPAAIAAEQVRIQAIIEDGGYQLGDIFNMDETGLFYAFAPDRGLSDRKQSGVKGNKVRLTYAFTANADGSEKRETIVIGKAKQPRCFQRKKAHQLGFYYRNNAKAWMITAIYQEWLSAWDNEMRLEGRKLLLVQDNFSAHKVPENLTHIRVENFAPNLTAHVQPLDAGIIRCFKAHYRKRYVQRAINNYDSGVTPAKIYDINQLEGMRIAASAWDDVSASTIAHCWIHSGILPPSLLAPAVPSASPSTELNPIALAEQALESSLDSLQLIWSE